MPYHVQPLRSTLRAARITAFVLTLVSFIFSLDLKYIPSLPTVITDASLGQYDLFGTGFGALMFIIHLDNADDPNTYDHLQIHYTATLTYSDNGAERSQVVYEGLSNDFTINPHETVIVPSTEFLKDNNTAVRASLVSTIRELDDPALKEQILTSQHIPDGTLSFSIQLLQNGTPFAQVEYPHKVINSTTIELIAPGNPVGQQPVDLYNPRPLFVWNSQLYPGIYGTDDVFEMRIYEARPGETYTDALGRLPVFTSRENAFQRQYPVDGRQLIPGYTYYWQVIGFVKGTSTTEIRSEVYGFRLLPGTDPKVLEVLAILQIILDNTILDQVDGYVSGVTVRINGE